MIVPRFNFVHANANTYRNHTLTIAAVNRVPSAALRYMLLVSLVRYLLLVSLKPPCLLVLHFLS